MENPEMYRRIEEKIALCGRKYEEDRDSAFSSTIDASELEMMRILYGRIKEGEQAEKLLAEWKEKLVRMEKEREREAQHPSFDWYDEHYHYKVLEGQCAAYRNMIGILEEAAVSFPEPEQEDIYMILDFKQMEETITPHFKGGEKEMAIKAYADEKNRIMLNRLIPGASVGLHTHEGSSEIIYILEGGGKVIYDGEERKIEAGQAHYCPEGHEHSMINDGPGELVFFAVVSQQ